MVKMGVCMIKSPSALDREAGLARTNGPVTHVRSGLAWDFHRSNLAPRSNPWSKLATPFSLLLYLCPIALTCKSLLILMSSSLRPPAGALLDLDGNHGIDGDQCD